MPDRISAQPWHMLQRAGANFSSTKLVPRPPSTPALFTLLQFGNAQ
jgi:hypothetical protein